MDSDGPSRVMDTERSRKRSACVSCRNSKMKCIRKSENIHAPCVRCTKAGRECVVVAPKMGRKVGSRNKFTELNQALRSLDQKTLQRVLGTTQEVISNSGSNVDLSRLYVEKYGTDDLSSLASATRSPLNQVTQSSSVLYDDHKFMQQQQQTQQRAISSPQISSQNMSVKNDSMVLINPNAVPQQDNVRWNVPEMKATPNSEIESSGSPTSSASAEYSRSSPSRIYGLRTSEDMTNPLGMLSDVCDTARLGRVNNSGSQEGKQTISLNRLGIVPDTNIKEGFDHVLGVATLNKSDTATWMEYFRKQSSSYLEINDPEFDPIKLGVFSEADAENLFSYYYSELFPLSMALDARLCTPTFLHRTSPFLLTAVCYSAAHFAPFCDEAMLKRISIHFEKSCELIKIRGYRSVSIIHGLLIGSGHTRPVKYFLEEKAWSNFRHALSIAIELGLYKIFSPDTTTDEHQSNLTAFSFELELNGIDPHSPEARYYRRHAERSYLHLHLWGSGLASSLNRPWKIQNADIAPEAMDSWHENPISIPEDHITAALITLRLHYAKLIAWINPLEMTHPDFRTITFATIRERIDSELGQWHLKWIGIPFKVDGIPKLARSPLYLPYLAFFARHTRLLLLSHAFKYHYSTIEDPSVPIFDCFQTGLANVRLVIQELQETTTLRYMVNNISMCVLYAAVGTLKFCPYLKHDNPSLNAVLIGLLGQLSQLMEQAGSDPPQRHGILQLYGRHLRVLIYNYMISSVGNQPQASSSVDENDNSSSENRYYPPLSASSITTRESNQMAQDMDTEPPTLRFPSSKEIGFASTSSLKNRDPIIVPQPQPPIPMSLPQPQPRQPPLSFPERPISKSSITNYSLPFESAHGWIDYNFDNIFEPAIAHDDLSRFDIFPKFTLS